MRSRTLGLILLCSSVALADDASLGQRVLFDASRIGPERWDAENITLRSDDGTLHLQLTGKDYASAAPKDSFEYHPDAALELNVASVEGGNVRVQIEWFDAKGKFLGSAPAEPEGGKLADLLDASVKPRRARLKFWLEGEGARATLAKAIVTAPRAFRQSGIRAAHTYGPASAVETDKGMRVEKTNDMLIAYVRGKAYSAFVLPDKVEFKPDAVLMLELDALSDGSLSVQAVCWDADNKYIKSVDVMKDVTSLGLSEVPLNLFAEQFPAQTKKLSFKIWLSGREPSAAMRGLYYGVGTEAP